MTLGKLGYAVAHGVEGADGMFSPQVVAQTGNRGNEFTAAALANNTYSVAGTYVLHNDLQYTFDPRMRISVTGYSATSWDDKSGNGDTGFLPGQTVAYRSQQALDGNNNQSTVTLPNQTTATCTGSIAILNDSAQATAAFRLANTQRERRVRPAAAPDRGRPFAIKTTMRASRGRSGARGSPSTALPIAMAWTTIAPRKTALMAFCPFFFFLHEP